MKAVKRSNAYRRDGALVEAAREGDEEAFERLYDTHADRVFAVVMGVVRDEATAADVTQDTFVKAWRQLSRLEKPASFQSWVARIARNAALDHVKVAGRTEAVDNKAITKLEEDANAAGSHTLVGLDVTDRVCRYDDPAQASEDAEVRELIWTAAEALGPNDASLLDLHLRHNMSHAQIARIIGASRHAAKKALYRLRAKLATSVQAAVLWRGGRPRCDTLRSALETASVVDFSQQAVGVIDRHVEHCHACEQRQRTLLSPTVLFEAIPIAAAPSELRDRIAAAIAWPASPSSVAGADVSAAVAPAGGERIGRGVLASLTTHPATGTVTGGDTSAAVTRVGTGQIGRGLLTKVATNPLSEAVARIATDTIVATVSVLMVTTLIAGTVGGSGSGPTIAAAAEPESIERNVAAPPVVIGEKAIRVKERSDLSDTPTPSGEMPRPAEVSEGKEDETPDGTGEIPKMYPGSKVPVDLDVSAFPGGKVPMDAGEASQVPLESVIVATFPDEGPGYPRGGRGNPRGDPEKDPGKIPEDEGETPPQEDPDDEPQDDPGDQPQDDPGDQPQPLST